MEVSTAGSVSKQRWGHHGPSRWRPIPALEGPGCLLFPSASPGSLTPAVAQPFWRSPGTMRAPAGAWVDGAWRSCTGASRSGFSRVFPAGSGAPQPPEATNMGPLPPSASAPASAGGWVSAVAGESMSSPACLLYDCMHPVPSRAGFLCLSLGYATDATLLPSLEHGRCRRVDCLVQRPGRHPCG